MKSRNIFEIVPNVTPDTVEGDGWHLVSDDLRLSLRLVDEVELGETRDGEFSFNPGESAHPLARIEVGVEGPWLVARGGPPVHVNGYHVRDSCRLYGGDEIVIGDFRFRMVQDLSQLLQERQSAFFEVGPIAEAAPEGVARIEIADEIPTLREVVPVAAPRKRVRYL